MYTNTSQNDSFCLNSSHTCIYKTQCSGENRNFDNAVHKINPKQISLNWTGPNYVVDAGKEENKCLKWTGVFIVTCHGT